MHLIVVYDDSEFLKAVQEVAKEYNIHVDAFKDKTPKAFKIKGHYGTTLTPFAVVTIKELEIPFYSEVKDCTVEHIKEILNRFYER